MTWSPCEILSCWRNSNRRVKLKKNATFENQMASSRELSIFVWNPTELELADVVFRTRSDYHVEAPGDAMDASVKSEYSELGCTCCSVGHPNSEWAQRIRHHVLSRNLDVIDIRCSQNGCARNAADWLKRHVFPRAHILLL